MDVFVSNPNNDTLKAAQSAWIAARFPWEQSEYLLFGVNNQKKAADFSNRELQLLKVLTVAFNQSAKDLTKNWVEGVESKSPRKIPDKTGQPYTRSRVRADNFGVKTAAHPNFWYKNDTFARQF